MRRVMLRIRLSMDVLEPRNDIHKIKYMARSIRVSSEDWVVERLKRQRTTIKWRPRARMRGLRFPVCRILVLDSIKCRSEKVEHVRFEP